MSEKVFTFEQLASHNTADDLWMAINGKVYDCTKFLDEHPGGEEVLIDCGGIDATGPFEDIGHSDDAKDSLATMLVGSLDVGSAPQAKQNVGASATTGGEDNVGLIIAIVVIILAIVAYLVFYN